MTAPGYRRALPLVRQGHASRRSPIGGPGHDQLHFPEQPTKFPGPHVGYRSVTFGNRRASVALTRTNSCRRGRSRSLDLVGFRRLASHGPARSAISRGDEGIVEVALDRFVHTTEKSIQLCLA